MNYVFQRLLAILILLAALPLIAAIAIANLLFNGWPVLYNGIRLGLNRKPFHCLKFRTMKTEADPFVDPGTIAEIEIYGKVRNDFRITRIGYILRRFSLDELPQLWNVIRGDMALVGPRPIVDSEDKIYGKYSDKLHSILPGMTGLWQVSGRNLTTYNRRIAINLYYVRHRSWKLDLWILYKTIWAVLGGRGAF